MKYVQLGTSDLNVSEVCLGTMTWGVQNNQADADAQLNYALSQGVNYIDTAEMYGIPPTPDTYGSTEKIIGNWLARNPTKRADIILATKITGSGLHWIRDGGNIDGPAIKKAVDQSLERLQTDYIDLYQLHWPNRTTPHFCKHWPGRIAFSPNDPDTERAQMHEILQNLDDCIKAGKIRHFGLSDDTTWGINTYLHLSEKFSLPRVVSIQNEFSLLHTKDWPYLIENCLMENIAYLPWSPMATGALSGKYLNGARPEGTRWSMAHRLGLFRDTAKTHAAVAAYKVVADKYDLSLATMALAWCKQVDGVTSTIIGATKLEQLEEDIKAFEVELSEEQLEDITEVLKKHPAPY